MSSEPPWLNGPPDRIEHCHRSRDEALDEHIANGCEHRCYGMWSDGTGGTCPADRVILIGSRDQHDNCDIGACDIDGDGMCECPCEDCRAVCRQIEAYDAMSDGPEADS